MPATNKTQSGKLETSPYDVAEFLEAPTDRAEYLDAWLDEAPHDIKGLSRAIGDIARAAGMSQIAAATGLSRESLCRALSDQGNPSFATVMKVLTALGIRLHAGPIGVGTRKET